MFGSHIIVIVSLQLQVTTVLLLLVVLRPPLQLRLTCSLKLSAHEYPLLFSPLVASESTPRHSFDSDPSGLVSQARFIRIALKLVPCRPRVYCGPLVFGCRLPPSPLYQLRPPHTTIPSPSILECRGQPLVRAVSVETN